MAGRRVKLFDRDVDLQAQRVIGPDGREQLLTSLEVDLLRYLLQSPDRAVPRGELLEQIWDYAANTRTRAVDNTVQRLRSKIEIDAKKPRHLLTVRGVGYRFAYAQSTAPTAPNASRKAPTPTSLAPAPINLTPALTTFVGRAQELQALDRCWAQGARLVTLVGPAGVGKTRLARTHGLAQWREGGAPAGCLFCDVSEAHNAADVEHELAQLLGVVLAGQADAARTRLKRALAVRGPLLLIVDNFEQVVETSAAMLATWLAAAPELRLLVTSRERLRLDGERCLEVSPLPTDDAAQLLVQRARSSHARLEQDVAQTLVQRLDRLPLAIELAAARLSLLSAEELLSRLDQPLQLLEQGARDHVPRQASMTGALQTSWQILDDDERAALCHLAMFQGGIAIKAAEQVLANGGVQSPLSVLQSLRDKSLLTTAEQGGHKRHRLLLSVRAFALEKAAQLGLTDRASRQHARYFLQHQDSDEDDLDQLAQERANLLAITERFATNEPAWAARAVLALDPLHYARGPGHVHLALLDDAVQWAARSGDRALTVQLWLARCEAWGSMGDVAAAQLDLRRAEQLAAQHEPSQQRVWLAAGNLARRQGDYDAALVSYERVLAQTEGEQTRPLRAIAFRQLGGCHTSRGAMDAAQQAFEQALEVYRALDDRRGQAWVLGMLGNVHLERAEHARGEHYHRRAMDMHRQLGNRRRLGIVMSNLAVSQHERGALAKAREHWEQALQLHIEVANRRFEGFALGGLGVLDHEQGALAKARMQLDAAYSIMRELGDRRWLAIMQARRAVLHHWPARIEQALAEVRQLLPERDRGALAVLSGFVRLAEAHQARERDEPDGAERVRAEAEQALAVSAADSSSFARISRRLLAAALERWPHR